MEEDPLTLIKRAARQRERQQDKLRDADDELRRLIREAFAKGLAGEQIAKAAGLSTPRVYQIRDGRR